VQLRDGFLTAGWKDLGTYCNTTLTASWTTTRIRVSISYRGSLRTDRHTDLYSRYDLDDFQQYTVS